MNMWRLLHHFGIDEAEFASSVRWP